MPNLWTLPSCPGSQEILTPPIRHVRKLSSDMEDKQVTTTDTPRTDVSKPKLTRESYDENWNMITDTPRTDAHCYHYDSKWATMTISPFGEHIQATFSRKLERELSASKAEVERLKELLNRAINEIEKTPFHTPKLTAFTAHRLADRYREKMTNTSTKPIESQEDDK